MDDVGKADTVAAVFLGQEKVFGAMKDELRKAINEFENRQAELKDSFEGLRSGMKNTTQ